MITSVVMPKLSDTMDEGKIIRWIKKEGDRVEAGDVIAEVETDKANVEMQAYAEGVIRKIVVKEGVPTPVGRIIAVIAEPSEDISELEKEAKAAKPPALPEIAKEVEEKITAEAKEEEAGEVEEVATRPGRKVRASFLARRLAREHLIDLTAVKGSGPGGRVVRSDIEAYLEAAKAKLTAAPPAEAMADYRDIELTGMRKTIAIRLTKSKAPVPHFYVTMEINMDEALHFKKSLGEAAPHLAITLNDILVKAAALAIKAYPDVNSSFLGDKIRVFNKIDMGVAVALEEGLVVPVIRDCSGKTLAEIGREAKDLISRAKVRKLKPEEYSGSTFTISNMGMLDVDDFAAIINPPEGAIMAVGAVKKRPVAKGDEVALANMMKVTLSCDHRAIDGATGALFLKEFKKVLENPALLAV